METKNLCVSHVIPSKSLILSPLPSVLYLGKRHNRLTAGSAPLQAAQCLSVFTIDTALSTNFTDESTFNKCKYKNVVCAALLI